MKDKYQLHLTRHTEDETYEEVKDSLSFSLFGNQTMAVPGPRSGIKKRTFYHLPEENIKARTTEVPTFQVVFLFPLIIR